MGRKVRIHQFLSKTGLFSSKNEIISAIKKGEMAIDGVITRDLHFQFDAAKRSVSWKGNKIRPIYDKIYILMNKPEGYLCSRLTKKDIILKKKSIFSLLEKSKEIDDKEKKTLFCVGRLDESSSGLILITNDGDLGSEITSPKNKIPKTYSVVLSKGLSDSEKSVLEKGVTIKLEENNKIRNYKTLPASISFYSAKRNQVNITIIEGKKRELRRMFESVDKKVISLKRISIGNINLNDLHINEGEYLISSNKFIKDRISKISNKSK